MAGEDGDHTALENMTMEALEERQQVELEQLEEKKEAMIEKVRSTAGKGKKAKEKIEAAEREAEQLEYEMRQRHAEETEQLTELLGSRGCAPAAAGSPADNSEQSSHVETSTAADEEEQARRKKEKALKKRQNRAAKEADKGAAKEQDKTAAGPSARQMEFDALRQQLEACRPPLQLVEVAADGNCLYHAVADQLRRAQPDLLKLPKDRAYEEVRGLCASRLRRQPDEYSPFAELKDGEDFDGYCDRVESSGDWGGELELRALADELHTQIFVHRADDSPLVLGDGGSTEQPLRVTFHKYYLTLGAHYNSVAPKRK